MDQSTYTKCSAPSVEDTILLNMVNERKKEIQLDVKQIIKNGQFVIEIYLDNTIIVDEFDYQLVDDQKLRIQILYKSTLCKFSEIFYHFFYQIIKLNHKVQGNISCIIEDNRLVLITQIRIEKQQDNRFFIFEEQLGLNEILEQQKMNKVKNFYAQKFFIRQEKLIENSTQTKAVKNKNDVPNQLQIDIQILQDRKVYFSLDQILLMNLEFQFITNWTLRIQGNIQNDSYENKEFKQSIELSYPANEKPEFKILLNQDRIQILFKTK
ncbi:hypothetical protein pb186bvf_010401 [Paramecium bursaria]